MGGDDKEASQPIFKKPQAAHIGANAERSCTNLFWLILFIGVWVGFVAFAGVAFSNGNIDRLIYGVDYLGNTCGQGTPQNVTSETAAKWSTLTYLWYPVGFNKKTGEVNIRRAKDLGICVAKCPDADVAGGVKTYSSNPPGNLPSSYYSWFNTKPKFHRCVPAFLDFNCTMNLDNANMSNTCFQSTKNSNSLFDTVVGFGDLARQGFADVKERWWVLLVCSIITIIFSFLWLLILKRAVKPMVTLTILLVLVVVGLVAGFCLVEWNRINNLENGDADTKKMYLAIGVISAVVWLILLIIIIRVRKDIMIACDIIEEAAQIPVAIPTMIAVPPVLVLLLVPLTIFFLFVAANVYTASSTISVMVPVITNSTDTADKVAVAQQQFSNWRPFGFAFCIFMFLWSYGFIHAIGFLIIAFCATFWYWSKPGSPKDPQHGVLKGVQLTLRYHLGTAAVGSLIIAVIQCIRIMVAWMEYQLREQAQKSDGVRCIICCAQCCLACFEAIIKFINKNAYILQTMTGEPFLDAAKHALSLLSSNIIAVAGVTVISEYVMVFSKIIITGISCGIGYLILSAGDDFTTAGLIFMLVFIGLISYFVAGLFMGVFGVCIDSVMLSYCYDLEQNNGQGRPYFFPEDLAQHLESARARMSEKGGDEKKQFEAEANYKQVTA